MTIKSIETATTPLETVTARGADEPTSPLWLVTREPLLNTLVLYLDDMRRRMTASPDSLHTFEFSRSELEEIRSAFARMIRQGEEKLHRICELLCGTFFDAQYTLQSVVIGEVDSSRERFTLAQTIAPADLYSQTDLDLGSRQLLRLRYLDGAVWSRASLVANFVEYQPAASTAWGIHKCISRIKAEEQIWNKVVDAIFGFDRLVRLDKQLCHLSHFVKDVFGVKIVVGDPAAARRLHEALFNLTWSADMLERHSVPNVPATSRLECIEVKDYISPDGRKETGWEAIKSVFKWWDIMIEVQVQPLWNYHQEREFLTRESHTGFKAHREALRNQIADTIPLFSFYRNLLRWLFLSPDEPAPAFSSVNIVLYETDASADVGPPMDVSPSDRRRAAFSYSQDRESVLIEKQRRTMAILETHDLTRCFGDLVAVDRLTLRIEAGQVFGLLGSNGAGKTTAIKMLTTLLPPTSGTATIDGFDIRKQAGKVRRLIGYVPQMISADGTLTGYENLLIFAKLYDIPRRERAGRIADALELMDLADAASRMVREYSGGMIRRLEIAQAMLHRPPVLFLDEPTVGLDPIARNSVWDRLMTLKTDFNTTIFLTTHLMEEADALCQEIAILHRGGVAVSGSPATLKASVDKEHATMNDVFVRYAGTSIDSGGTYGDVSRTRRTARRVG